MKLCFPVVQDLGVNSEVYEHFGSAPFFMVVDLETGESVAHSNSDKEHSHGACNPARAVADLSVDGIVVGGIGRGALMSLNRAGYRVFQAQGSTVRDNLLAAQGDGLAEFSPGHVCGGHSHDEHGVGGGCCH